MAATRAIVAVLAAGALAGCNTLGELDPSTQAKLNHALAITCPFLPAIGQATINSNAAIRGAFYVAEASCPPNPPPSNIYSILAMIAAAVTLGPYHR